MSESQQPPTEEPGQKPEKNPMSIVVMIGAAIVAYMLARPIGYMFGQWMAGHR